jgi:hypothetical protein
MPELTRLPFSFFTLALDGGEWSVSRPGERTPGTRLEIHGDELHRKNAGSAAGVNLGLSPGAEKDGEDL